MPYSFLYFSKEFKKINSTLQFSNLPSNSIIEFQCCYIVYIVYILFIIISCQYLLFLIYLSRIQIVCYFL